MKARILYIGNQVSGRNSTPSLIDRLSPRLARRGYEMVTASAHPRPWGRALDMGRALAIHGSRVDRVLIDTYSTLAFHYAWVAGEWARAKNKPYYPILHGGALESRMLRSPRLCRRFFGNSRKNILVSDFLAPAMEERGFSYEIIPNGLDLEKFPFRERTQAGPRLLWVRAFASLYQPLMALDLVRRLIPLVPDIQLRMIGPDIDGSLGHCRQKAREWGLEEQVAFSGPMTQEQWAAASREADLFINTSRVDNMPVSLLEALALGLPLISLNSGGIPRMIRHGREGWLVSSVDEMARAVVFLMDHPALAQGLSREGRKKAETLGWTAIEEKWMDLWERE